MPIYSITGPDGTEYSIEGPANATREDVIRAVQAKMQPVEAPAPVYTPPAPSTERTIGEALKDVPAAALTGAGSLLKFPGQLVSLIPGLQKAGEVLATPGEFISQTGEDLKSAGLKAREALRSEALSEAEKDGILSQFATAITSTIKDPALLTSFVVEQVPLLLGPGLAAKITQKIGAKGIELAGAGLTGKAAEQAVEEAAKRVSQRAVGAAVGTGAAMQAADISSDTYKAAYDAAINQGMSPEEAQESALNAARLSGTGAFGTSLLTSKLPGGSMIERRLAGVPGRGRISGALGEAGSEGLEETGGQIFRNIGIRTIDPEQSLTEGVGTAAGLGVLGGGFFGALLGKKPSVELAPGQLPGETLYDTANRLNAEIQSLNAAIAGEAKDAQRQQVGLKTSTELVDMYREEGYAAVKQYQIALEEQAKNTELPREEREAARGLAKDIGQFFTQIDKEEIARKQVTPPPQNVLTDNDVRVQLGFPGDDPVYEKLVGKNIGVPEQAEEVLATLDEALQRKGLRQTQRERIEVAKATINDYLSTIPGSGFYVPVSEPSGTGVPVAGVTAGRAAPQRPATSEPLGVAGTAADVGRTVEGKGRQPTTVTPVKPAELPEDLKGAKPRYAYGPKQFQVEFASDLDKALFITAQKTPSKRDADYRQWLMSQGYTPQQIAQGGTQVRAALKEMARAADPKAGPITLPVQVTAQPKQSLKPGTEARAAEILKGLEEAPVEAPEETEAPETEKEQLIERRAEVIKQFDAVLKRILAKYGLKDVELNLEEALESEGSYARQIITLALNIDNPVRVLKHESIHALKDMGFFTDAQWKTLIKRANDEWIDVLKNTKHDASRSRYDAYVDHFTSEAKSKGLNDEQTNAYIDEAIVEEAIADAFGAFEVSKAPPGLMNAILNRMRNLFKAIKEAFNVVGIESAEDIFGRIEEGKLKPTKDLVAKKSVKEIGAEDKGLSDEAVQPREPSVRPSIRGRQGIEEVPRRRPEPSRDGGRRDQGRSLAPLAGAPNVQGATGPDPRLVEVAESYAKRYGIPYSRQGVYVEVDEDRARRIAQAYEDMAHAPQDPKVKKAYRDLIEQTRNQYDALIDAGYSFTFFDSNTDPYGGNPFNAMRDLRQNKTMAVYGTYDGYGTEGITGAAVEDNPMLADTGLRWPDQNGVEHMVTANDLFRAVHDAFGHGLEGAGFRARGEENAWQAHIRLFTGPAVGAITSETRGQNSWLNYGPFGDKNRTAKLENTVFAEQKTGLMPDWTWTDGAEESEAPTKASLRGIVLGTKQPEAQSYTGTHYGNAKVNTLLGEKYGTGIRGAERRRLDNTDDNRIKRRVYFYIPKTDGTMPVPEAGLGQYVYTQKFDNILGIGKEMSRLFNEAMSDGNTFESLVVDAGYDGYAVPNMGMMVILNHDAPVEYKGTRVELAEKKSLRTIDPNSLFAKRMQNIGIKSTDDFWKRIQNVMIGTGSRNPALSAIGDTRSTSDQVKQAISVWKQDVKTSGIKKYLQRFLISTGVPEMDDIIGAKIIKNMLVEAGIRPTLANAISAYDALPEVSTEGAINDTRFSLRAPTGLYSALTKGVTESKTTSAPAQGWKDQIKGLINKGQVKSEEVEWSGVNDWLDLQAGKVSKDDLEDYLRSNGVQVEEVQLGGPRRRGELRIEFMEPSDTWAVLDEEDNIIESGMPDEDAAEAVLESLNQSDTIGTKYDTYVLPGGQNYREVLLLLPTEAGKKITALQKRITGYDNQAREIRKQYPIISERPENIQQQLRMLSDLRDELYEQIDELGQKKTKATFQSKHWAQPNVLAHIRLNDRTDADGNKVLFVEEIQSDWGQAGKKKGFVSAKNEMSSLVKKYDTLNAERRKVERQIAEGDDADPATQVAVDRSVVINQEMNTLADQMTAIRSGLPAAPFVATRKFAVFKDGQEVTRTDKDGKETKQRYDSLEAAQAAAKKVDGEARDLGMQASTEGWLNLALKRIMAIAGDEGYDKVAFVTGEQSKTRYKLSEHINSIRVGEEYKGLRQLSWRARNSAAETAAKFNKDGVITDSTLQGLEGKTLDEVFGKELAEKLIASKPYESFSGLDLDVGGEGMEVFYDKIVPSALKKLLPKVGGGSIENVNFVAAGKRDTSPVSGEDVMYALGIPVNQQEKYWAKLTQTERDRLTDEYRMRDAKEKALTQPGFDVTPAMKEKVAEGLPLFSLRSPETPQFKFWFGNSKVVDKDGKPKVMYHGTARDISVFQPKQAGAIFVTDDPEFAASFASMSATWMGRHADQFLTPEQLAAGKKAALEKIRKDYNKGDKLRQKIIDAIEGKSDEFKEDALEYLGKEYKAMMPSGPNLIPVYVKADNPFDYSDPKHMRQLEQYEAANKYTPNSISDLVKLVESGAWEAIENPRMQQVIRGLGFDGFYVKEGGRKNLAVYSPNQLKSVFNEAPTERPELSLSLRSLVSNAMTPNVKATINKIAPPRYDPSLWERVLDAVAGDTYTRTRAAIVNRVERFAEYDRRVAKQIEAAGGVQQFADSKAEPAALFADLGGGLLESALGANDRFGGAPVYRNGVTVISSQNGRIKGPILIFKPLADLKDPEAFRLFQTWAAVKRGRRLDIEGREQLIDKADMAVIRAMEQSNPDLIKLFERVQKDWMTYNNALVKYMVDTGVITPEMAKEWTRHGDYFPFYRLVEEDVQGPRGFKSLGNVKPPRKLKGGESPLGDFFENIVRNSKAAIEAGIKNVAAQRATNQALLLQEVTRLPKKESGINVYRVLENGKEVYYKSHDPLFIEAIKCLNMPDLPFIGLLAGPANILRNLVTKDPAFMLANMMRDSLSAYVTSGVKMTPIIDTARNFAKTIANKSPETRQLYAAGVLGGYDYSRTITKSAREFEKRLREVSGTKTTAERLATPFTSLWGALEKGTQASDAATRAEVYKRVLAQTGNEAEAYWQALEVMNFNRRGNSPVIRILTAAIPFLNARMQGLDLLYRTAIYPVATSAPQAAKERMKTFWVRGMTMMALSSMYWMLTHDDDEYKKQEQETRDNYWLVPSLGIKLPIPFEVGVMFKVIPERIMGVTFGADTHKDFTESMKRQFTSTFGFNFIPQVFLPAVEVATNHSFFTQRPVIGKGLEDVAPAYQIGPSTSKIAQAIGQSVGYSPIKIDHLIKGYTGTIGTYAVDLMDMMFEMTGESPKASKRFEQMPVLRRFALDPEARGTVTAYYGLKDSVDEAVRTSNLLERSMNFKDYGEYMQDNIRLLATKDYLNALEKDMKQFREMKNMIRSSQMSADQKRDSLVSIGRMEQALTNNIQVIKKAAQ